jgi:hypothetical protein
MMDSMSDKVYPLNFNTIKIRSQLTKKKERFRRSTVVYSFINYIVKNVYLINDDIDDNKKTE